MLCKRCIPPAITAYQNAPVSSAGAFFFRSFCTTKQRWLSGPPEVKPVSLKHERRSKSNAWEVFDQSNVTAVTPIDSLLPDYFFAMKLF